MFSLTFQFILKTDTHSWMFKAESFLAKFLCQHKNCRRDYILVFYFFPNDFKNQENKGRRKENPLHILIQVYIDWFYGNDKNLLSLSKEVHRNWTLKETCF